MQIAVLADTHIPKRAKDLPPKAYSIIEEADAIIHAGDVLTLEFLDKLSAYAPVYAVLGNNDVDLHLPERLELSFEGVNIGIIHDSGDKKGRAKRLRRQFNSANMVIFGHSHIPISELCEGLWLFNPGSATDKRRQIHFTMGLLNLKDGNIDARIIEL